MGGEGNWFPEVEDLEGMTPERFPGLFLAGIALVLGIIAAIALLAMGLA